jgi:hypothetical protein
LLLPPFIYYLIHFHPASQPALFSVAVYDKLAEYTTLDDLYQVFYTIIYLFCLELGLNFGFAMFCLW